MNDQRTGRIGMHRRQELLRMIWQGMTAGQMADVLDVNPETIRKFARKRDIQIRPEDMSGENHPCWNGGTTLDRSGYLLVRVPKDGEFGYLIRAIQKRSKAGSDPNGYAPAHRIEMHKKLGRALVKGEVVDHIDGDVRNNAPSNLRVFASNAEHLRATLKGKCPNWTPEGWAKMCSSKPRWSQATKRQRAPSASRTKTDDPA